ncbi:3-hydroxyacyl-ACP dehydratase FabZ family protein [Paenibacillus sp. 1P03SA]|uniref:3-hydroxyacyl-ACP dehydratase FabZ family protein n=1 Tax=Paenibacillus sp. 1P03SA TaxID=3132294 RepID=UPI0039A1118E
MSRAPDYRHLLAMLPHQFPLRVLDEVKDYSPGKFLIAGCSPEPLKIYFGGTDTIPPTLLIEGLAQACVILTQLETAPLAEDEVPLLGAIKAKLLNPVSWQESILYKVEPVRILSKKAIFTGTLYRSDGTTAVSAELSVAVAATSNS